MREKINSFNKKLTILLIITLFLTLSATFTFADQYKPYLHNPVVPSEKNLDLRGVYSTNLFDGAAKYSYNIEVPKGTNDLQPELQITYNSHNKNQQPDVMGNGWSITSNYIQRDTEYTQPDEDDTFDLYFNGQKYDLVYVANEDRYHTDPESYMYIEKDGPWFVKTKDGTTYELGGTTDSTVNANHEYFIWRWYLSSVTDTHSNYINYTYQENPFPDDTGTVYLDSITYNTDQSREINFIYENSNRPDMRMVFTDWNELTFSRRLQEIEINVDNQLVRKYSLDYETSTPQSQSFIDDIEVFGSDGSTSLPETSFEYYDVTKGWNEDSNWEVPTSDSCFIDGNDDNGVRFVDFTGDGLVDVLVSMDDHCDASDRTAFVNTGNGWTQDDSWQPPEALGEDDCFVDDHGRDQGYRFGDVNGDGKTDILVGFDIDGSGYCADDERTTYISGNYGWVQDDSMQPLNCFVDDDGEDTGARLADVNGDGLVDIIGGKMDNGCGSDQRFAYINTGSGWTIYDGWKPPVCFADPGGDDEGYRLVDVNGDGLVDILYGSGYYNCGSSSRTAYINTGSGWVQDDSWEPPICFIDNTGGEDLGARLADVNGDGLVDILYGSRDGLTCDDSERTAYINTGSGWVQDDTWQPNTCFVDYDDGDNEGVKLADVNGDGLVDILEAKEDGYCDGADKTTWINNAAKTGLIEEVESEYGGTTEINYMQSTLLDNTGDDDLVDLSFNMWVVEDETKDNGMSGAHQVSATTTYDYSDGIYDYEEKEFKGFNYVEEEKANGDVVKHWYHQDDGLEGQEYYTELYDDSSNIYEHIEYDWISSSQNGYDIIKLEAKFIYEYEPGTNNDKRQCTDLMEYDNYGNLIQIRHHGDNNYNIDGNTKWEHYEYVYNTDDWIVDTVSRQYFRDFYWNTIEDTYYIYDGLSYGDSPIYGDVTQTEYWLDTGDNPITTKSYDSYGNLISETDSNTHTTQYIYGNVDTTYTYPDEKINAKGQTTTYSYDLGTGNILSETDPNSYTTEYEYDVFGRKLKEIKPYDSSTYPTVSYSYSFDGNAPEYIKTAKREESGTYYTYDSYVYYDGFGTVMQTKTEAESSQQIVNNFYYDEMDRIEESSNPYFESYSTSYSTPDTSIPSTEYIYDPLDRITQVINPDGTDKEITFDRWEITLYDENDNQITYHLDGFDRIYYLVEYLNGVEYWTSYNYDEVGNIDYVRDVQGNYIDFDYDSIGRLASLIDPDLGELGYYYDGEGNLVEKEDANGNVLNLYYDELNRVIEKTDGSEVINYVYDDQVTGTLSRITTPDYSTAFNYDERLRLVSEEVEIDGITFTKEQEHDAMDRLDSKETDGHKTLEYTYDDQSNIGSLYESSYILDNVGYNENNNPTEIEYNNGLITEKEYDDEMFRLVEFETGSLQRMLFIYDNVGNIDSMANDIDSWISDLEYDDLNRLTGVERSSVNMYDPSDNYEISYNYDIIGNILDIDYVTLTETEEYDFTYAGNPVHAPSSLEAPNILENCTGDHYTIWGLTCHFANECPVMSTIATTPVREGELATINTTVSDSDGDQVDVSYSSPFDDNGEWQTQMGDEGDYTITVSVDDSYGCVVEELVSIEVLPNYCPVISVSDIIVRESELASINAAISDSDGDPLTITYSSPFDNNGEWQTQIGDQGDYTVSITAEDDHGCLVEEEINVEVLPNHCPEISSTQITVTEGDLAVINVTDLDNDPLAITYSNLFDNNGEWQTHDGDEGNYVVIVTAEDDHSCMQEWEVYVEVLPNHCPIITVSDVTVIESELVAVNAEFYDEDEDELIISYFSPLNNTGEWQTEFGEVGTYQTSIVADDNECVTTENIIIEVLEAPDLELEPVILSNPDDACLYESYVQLNINNLGDGDAEDITWRVLDENNNMLDSDTISLIEVGHQSLRFANFEIENEQEITIQIDYDNSVTEDDETNNEQTLFIECAEPTEDVELYSITLVNPDDACISELSLELRIRNLGQEDEEYVTYRVLDEDSSYLYLWTIDLLEVGHEAMRFASFEIDHEQEITVQVDYHDEIAETNENNNEEILLIECDTFGINDISHMELREDIDWDDDDTEIEILDSINLSNNIEIRKNITLGGSTEDEETETMIDVVPGDENVLKVPDTSSGGNTIDESNGAEDSDEETSAGSESYDEDETEKNNQTSAGPQEDETSDEEDKLKLEPLEDKPNFIVADDEDKKKRLDFIKINKLRYNIFKQKTISSTREELENPIKKEMVEAK
jgi:YD repeat-containing protein